MVQNLLANAGDMGSIPGLGRFPGVGNWQPTSAFLPGKSRGQRSLAGDSPWGHRRIGHNLGTDFLSVVFEKIKLQQQLGLCGDRRHGNQLLIRIQ